MPYPNEHSCRLAEPGDGPFRRKQKAARIEGRWVDHIYQRRGERMELQAVRFPREEGWETEAATREAREWCQQKGGQFEPMREDLEADHAEDIAVRLYVQKPLGVRLEDRDDGTYLIGLPLLRTGRWNGIDYDADRLRALQRNHRIIQQREGLTPALKSRHTYAAGQAENVDAADVTLGWITALQFDEASGVLLGDIKVVQPSMLDDIMQERVRYVSVEIMPSYITMDGEEIGPALIGAAWVDWPAVRGLPWEIILNREEWAELARGELAEPATAEAQQRDMDVTGGDRMPMWSRFLDVLTGIFAGREKIEALAEFRELNPLVGAADADGQAEGKTPETLAQSEPPAQAKEPATEPARDEVETLREAYRAAEARIAELERAYRAAQVEGLVDKLIASGVLRPAIRGEVAALLDLLLQSDREVEVSAEGGTETMKAQDVLVRILRGTTPKLEGPPGRTHPGLGEEDEDKPHVYSDEELARLVALANK